MIKSFKHKGLQELFSAGGTRKVQSKRAARLNLMLTLLNAATHAGQMNAPGLSLHPLKGKPAGRFAAEVYENCCVIFRFEAGHAVEVDYGDYH